jgi:hypothetical protein
MKLRNLHSRDLSTLFTEDALDNLRAKLDGLRGDDVPEPDIAPGEAVLPDEDIGAEEPIEEPLGEEPLGEEPLEDPMGEEPLEDPMGGDPMGEEPLGPEEDLGGGLETPESAPEPPPDPWEEMTRGSAEYAELVDNKSGRIFNKFNVQRIFKLSDTHSNGQEIYLSIEPYASNPKKSMVKIKDKTGDVKSWGVVTDDLANDRVEKAKRIANKRLGVDLEKTPEPGLEPELGPELEPGLEAGLEAPGAEMPPTEPIMPPEEGGIGMAPEPSPLPAEEEGIMEL